MLIKCTKCDINLIPEGEEFCSICKSNKLPNKTKHKFAPKDYNPTTVIEEEFLKYLEYRGYSMYTPSDLQSTAYSYLKAVNRILYNEGLTWEQLVNVYKSVIPVYDNGGAKEHIGNKSHKTNINALKRFADFIDYKNTIK